MEPVPPEPVRDAHEVEGADPSRPLSVELVAGDAAEAGGPHHVMAGLLRLRGVGRRRDLHGLQGVRPAEGLDERTDVRLAELGHARVEIGSVALAPEQDVRERFGLQLRAHERQRGRQAPLVSHLGPGSGEEGPPLRRDPAETGAGAYTRAVRRPAWARSDAAARPLNSKAPGLSRPTFTV